MYDLVYCNQILKEIENLSGVLNKIRRVEVKNPYLAGPLYEDLERKVTEHIFFNVRPNQHKINNETLRKYVIIYESIMNKIREGYVRIKKKKKKIGLNQLTLNNKK